MGQRITVQEAADRLGVCGATINNWIAQGRLKATRLGPRLIRLELEDVDAFGDALVSE